MVYGHGDAIERRFDHPSRDTAVEFVIGLVQQVEARLLEDSTSVPETLVRAIVEEAVPASPAERRRLCEQFDIGVLSDEVAGRRLNRLARELCVSITENLTPILRASQPQPPGAVSHREAPVGNGARPDSGDTPPAVVADPGDRLLANGDGLTPRPPLKSMAEVDALMAEVDTLMTEVGVLMSEVQATPIAEVETTPLAEIEATPALDDAPITAVPETTMWDFEGDVIDASAPGEDQTPKATSIHPVGTEGRQRPADRKALGLIVAGTIVLLAMRRRARRRASA
jgi:hypothetical protein